MNRQAHEQSLTHLPVDKRIEDHEAEERDEVHDEEVHPHDVHLLVVVVLAELRRDHDHEGDVVEFAHLVRGTWVGGQKGEGLCRGADEAMRLRNGLSRYESMYSPKHLCVRISSFGHMNEHTHVGKKNCTQTIPSTRCYSVLLAPCYVLTCSSYKVCFLYSLLYLPLIHLI